jgi:hypothetical protein
MAVQYVRYASPNAMWCGTLFALRALFEILLCVFVLAPRDAIRRVFLDRRAAASPYSHDDDPSRPLSVHHAGHPDTM